MQNTKTKLPGGADDLFTGCRWALSSSRSCSWWCIAPGCDDVRIPQRYAGRCRTRAPNGVAAFRGHAIYDRGGSHGQGINIGTTRIVTAAVDRGNYPTSTFDTREGTAHWFPSLVALRGDERRYGWDVDGAGRAWLDGGAIAQASNSRMPARTPAAGRWTDCDPLMELLDWDDRRARDKTHTVVASAGIGTLGGDDFDHLLAEMAAGEAVLAGLSGAELFRLLDECRRQKEALHPNTRKIAVDLDHVREGWGRSRSPRPRSTSAAGRWSRRPFAPCRPWSGISRWRRCT